MNVHGFMSQLFKGYTELFSNTRAMLRKHCIKVWLLVSLEASGVQLPNFLTRISRLLSWKKKYLGGFEETRFGMKDNFPKRSSTLVYLSCALRISMYKISMGFLFIVVNWWFFAGCTAYCFLLFDWWGTALWRDEGMSAL